jgi:HSP20 family protein
MERMMERVLEGRSAAPELPGWVPAADVYETAEELVLLVEVAGVDPASLELTLDGEVLRLSGQRPDSPHRADCVAVHQMEIEFGRFERLFAVPAGLDGSRADARFDAGFLEVRLPKRAAEPRRTTRVPIKTHE